MPRQKWLHLRDETTQRLVIEGPLSHQCTHPASLSGELLPAPAALVRVQPPDDARVLAVVLARRAVEYLLAIVHVLVAHAKNRDACRTQPISQRIAVRPRRL